MLRSAVRSVKLPTSALCKAAPSGTIVARHFSRSTVAASDVRPTSLSTFTEEEEMLRESVRRFAEDVVAPKVREMDESEMMDKSVITGLFEQGLMAIETPAEYGGAESSFTSAIVAIEELARIDPSVSVLCDVHNTLVCTIVRKYGSKEQQEKWLPLLSESMLGSFCLSEPASGSDAFALQTRAVKDGNEWVLNGTKMWITNSYEADFFLIFANIDPSKGYKGITCFIATKDMGVKIAKKEQKLGIRASSTCSLAFDDLRIPAENVIGGEGKGYKIAIEILNEGRIGIAGQMLGLAQGAFDKAVPYTFQRTQFGKPIGTFQGMQFQQAEAGIDIEAARLLTYNAARRKEEGLDFVREAAMAKYYASQVAQRVSGAAIEWCGGIGFTRETGIEKYWRDSKIGAIYEGTSNIQLQTIAKMIQKQYS
ncbi:acyl-CoA oxidase [Fomes fomentarius]|nr:acyl-CoA oxidase [Fomes fomentarius]